MDPLNEPMVADLANRILDLRDKLALETDPERRSCISREIDDARRDLAILLTADRGAGEPADWFLLARDEDGTMRLYLRDLPMPVNPAYLDYITMSRRMEVPARASIGVSPFFALEAIDEAQASAEHSLAFYEQLKNRLAFFNRVAETLCPSRDESNPHRTEAA